MVGIEVRFLAGRYHATPWGRHVNEGVVEWPPSPWRFLRALIATWHRCQPEMEEPIVREALMELTSAPVFSLPSATVGQTRHYMPWDKDWGKKRHAAKTKIFDTFVCTSKDDPVRMFWPESDLPTAQQDTLDTLLASLTYLGRAESWCEATRFPTEDYEQDEQGRVVNTTTGEIAAVRPVNDPGEGTDRERVRTLLPREDLDQDQALNDDHPLCIDTTTLRKDLGRSDPPGARWVQYLRDADALEEPLARPTGNGPSSDRPNPKIVRFQLGGSVLPSVTKSLQVGSLARAAAMSRYGQDEETSPIFSGKDEAGEPLKGHRHTFYLPSDEDGDGELDHLTFYAQEGFDRKHLGALDNLEKVYGGKGGKFEVQTLLLGQAETADDLKQDHPLLGEHATWSSVTPYLLSRHPHTTSGGQWKTEPIPGSIEIREPGNLGRFPTAQHLFLEYGVIPEEGIMQEDGPLSQLLLSVRRRRNDWDRVIPALEAVEPVPSFERQGIQHRWLDFKRYRRPGPNPVDGKGYGFRLYFEEPFHGPLSLGVNCHYGLGLFLGEE